MEAGQRAARDRDEDEREQRAGEDRALPLEANSVTASFSIIGSLTTMPTASSAIVPIFMKVDR